MTSIRINLIALLVIHILPFVITQILIMGYAFPAQKNGKRVKWICTGINILLNGLVVYGCTQYVDVREILELTCSYQDIARLATSNVVALVAAVLLGMLIRSYVCRYYKDEEPVRISSRLLLLLFIAAAPIVFGYFQSSTGAANLEIVEVCRRTTITDPEAMQTGDKVSYVTVTNNGGLTYELNRMYLSDDEEDLKKEQFPKRSYVRPGSTYKFTLDEDALDIDKIGGSIVYLVDPYGNAVDSVTVPALDQEESYRKTADGWQIVSLAAETVTVEAPTFSHESGFYDSDFRLELTGAPGTTVYYTTDSTNPTALSVEYANPIHVINRSGQPNAYRSIRNVQTDYENQSFNGETPVDKCFVVRAIAVDANGNTSDIVTKSYFVGLDQYKNRNVVSLVCDPYGLFSADYGIYVTGEEYDAWYAEALVQSGGGAVDTRNDPTMNFEQTGIDWERESNFEVFENAKPVLNQAVGIRIQGGSTRFYPDKRFSIIARKIYSASSYFDVDLINAYSQHALFTRQGDMHAISQLIGKGRDVVTIDFMEVDVFLDGEFWYTTYLYEKFDEKNFAQKYGLTDDNIVKAKYAGSLEVVDGLEDGKNPFSNVTDYIKGNDLTEDENYQTYSEMLDIQSYIDWSCINAFMQNMDYSEEANNLFWHTVIPENDREGDTRWRLGLYDMDLGWENLTTQYGNFPYYEANPFTMIATWEKGPLNEWPIFTALKANKDFCRQYVLTFMDLINTNFSVENTTAILDKLNITSATTRAFFANRANYVVPLVAEEFELTGTRAPVTISANVSGAPITLNTITPELQASDSGYSWTGSYFTDYPVTVTTDAENFSYWIVTANGRNSGYYSRTIEVPVTEGGVQIRAVFQ